MQVDPDLKSRFRAQAQGAMSLDVAYIGVVNGLFATLERLGSATSEALADAADMDSGYARRWCDAAYGFGYLDEAQGRFHLTESGLAMSPDAPASSVAPIARAPSSAPNRNITKKESGAAGDITIVRPAAAAPPRRPEQVEMRHARVFGDHPPRDKEHHLASRKCRRESTPQTARFQSAGIAGSADSIERVAQLVEHI